MLPTKVLRETFLIAFGLRLFVSAVIEVTLSRTHIQLNTTIRAVQKHRYRMYNVRLLQVARVFQTFRCAHPLCVLLSRVFSRVLYIVSIFCHVQKPTLFVTTTVVQINRVVNRIRITSTRKQLTWRHEPPENQTIKSPHFRYCISTEC